ncbi:hypothetical protein [Kitasatospora sp. NBC_01266]|uniref:hypothetical protein n=1 Tax=Kitasatospora sp. NBC_01266 TaxID=2903572 RepID=UPI002E332A9D|nr:hypothetical protein [Kitasatospora sp. NBC_01266]
MPISENTALPDPFRTTTTLARLAQWRTGSRICAAIDVAAGAAGAVLLLVAAGDSLVSWPSNRVLLGHDDLSHIAGAILIPCWVWLIGSLALVTGVSPARRSKTERAARRAVEKEIWRAMFPGRRVRIGLGVAAVLCLGVVVGGFVVGGAKGSARTLPGPSYQVSVQDLNDSAWTDVPRDQYDRWRAEFVREDGMFTIFGLFLVGGSLGLRRLHRRTPPR